MEQASRSVEVLPENLLAHEDPGERMAVLDALRALPKAAARRRGSPLLG